MGRQVRAKPKSPQVAAAEKRAKAFEAVGLSASQSTLPSNDDIEAEVSNRATAQQKGNVERASRTDAFKALKDGMQPGAYDAARRLEKDILTAAGEHDRGRATERVDGDHPKGRLDAQIDASRRVAFIEAWIGKGNFQLLSELISPSVRTRLCGPNWRNIVALLTHEANAHAQAAVVRTATAFLAAAYQACEQQEADRKRFATSSVAA